MKAKQQQPQRQRLRYCSMQCAMCIRDIVHFKARFQAFEIYEIVTTDVYFEKREKNQRNKIVNKDSHARHAHAVCLWLTFSIFGEI